MGRLKQTLPPSVGGSRGVEAILDSCQQELDVLEQQARAASHRLAAATADEKGVALWEKELGLAVREDLSLEARRNIIRIALEQMETCTPQRLLALVGRMLEGECTLEEQFGNYRLLLSARVSRFLVPSLHQVEQALRMAIPAHLDFQLTATGWGEGELTAGRALVSGMKLEIRTEEEIT